MTVSPAGPLQFNVDIQRTAKGTLPDVLRVPKKQAQIVLLLESITTDTKLFPLH